MCFICAQRDPSDALAGSQVHSTNTPTAITDSAIWASEGLVTETTDASANSATAYELTVGQSALGSISSATDADWYAIDLVAGKTYDIRLLGFGSDFLTDPLVRLRDASGTIIVSNDDGFTSGSATHERDAALSYTATSTGTFYVQADAYSTQTGTYLLSVTRDVAGDMPEVTVDEIAWQLINNGSAYFGSTEALAFDVGTDNSLSVDISGLTTKGAMFATAALDIWSAYLGFDFEIVTSGAEITFDDADAYWAYAQIYDDGTNITSSIVNVGTGWIADDNTLDTYSFETYLHEIGHALGLAHGGNYNGSADYGTSNFYVNDALAWSIMSYMQSYGDDISGGQNSYVDAYFQDMYSPMIADIIAMQYLYGTSASTFSGDTTYGFNANTGNSTLDNAATLSGKRMALTVFDTGGTDTLDFSETGAAQVISLASESLSSVLGGRHNLGIARGVVIENAISGRGDDKLVGNSADNELTGGTGDDTLNGGGGNDTLIGGGGNDYYVFSGGTDVIIDTLGTNGILSGAAIDLTASSISSMNNAKLTGRSAVNIIGNTLDNLLEGNRAANTLTGGDGSDTLDGGSGSDALYGGIGTDVIYGGVGADTIAGGDGVDQLSYATSEEAVFINLANGRASGGYADGDVISQIEVLRGSLFADRLSGENGGEALSGLRGDDMIYGGAGDDSLTGGGDKDALYGGIGRDTFYFKKMQDVTTSADTCDVIFDFARGSDKIDLSIIDASSVRSTDEAFIFRGKGPFGTASQGEMRCEKFNLAGTRNDYTLVYIDTDADQAAEGVIKVMGLHNFTAGDFIL